MQNAADDIPKKSKNSTKKSDSDESEELTKKFTIW